MKIIGIETRLRYEDKEHYSTKRIEAKMLPFELEIPEELFAVGDWNRKPILEFTVHTSRGDVNCEAVLSNVWNDGQVGQMDSMQKAIEAMK